MRDYIREDGLPVAEIPTAELHRHLNENVLSYPGGSVPAEDLAERIRLELYIRSLGLHSRKS